MTSVASKINKDKIYEDFYQKVFAYVYSHINNYYDAQDLTYYPDVYTYNKDGLMFVSADLAIEDKDFLTTISALKDFIPSDATYDTNYSSEIDTEYGDCDLYYKSGNYYYIVYAEDWSEVVYAKFDMVPSTQVEAYREKAYGNEDDWDWGDDDWDDWSDEDWEEYLNSLTDEDYE